MQMAQKQVASPSAKTTNTVTNDESKLQGQLEPFLSLKGAISPPHGIAYCQVYHVDAPRQHSSGIQAAVHDSHHCTSQQLCLVMSRDSRHAVTVAWKCSDTPLRVCLQFQSSDVQGTA